MSTLEMTFEELKRLSPAKLDEAAGYIRRLKLASVYAIPFDQLAAKAAKFAPTGFPAADRMPSAHFIVLAGLDPAAAAEHWPGAQRAYRL